MMGYFHSTGGRVIFPLLITFIIHDTMNIYILTPIVLFCLVTYACSEIFNLNYTQIKHCNSENTQISDTQISQLLFDWKKRHQWGCLTLSAINYCFGWILLLLSCFFCLHFVYLTFFIYHNNVTDFSLFLTCMDSAFIVGGIIQLYLMCWPGDYLRSKVHKINNYAIKHSFNS